VLSRCFSRASRFAVALAFSLLPLVLLVLVLCCERCSDSEYPCRIQSFVPPYVYMYSRAAFQSRCAQ
jgi:hypothetical protein